MNENHLDSFDSFDTFDTAAATAATAAAAAASTAVKSKIPGYTELKNHEGQTLYTDTKLFDRSMRLLDLGISLFFFGPKGASKTETANAILTHRGLPVFQGEFGAVSSGDQLDGKLLAA